MRHSDMNAMAKATLYINDRPRPLADGQRLAGLIRELGLAEKKGVAVAINGAVVPRSQWGARELAAADRVLVIQATQAG